MTLDDYKELMKFHLLLTNEDLSGMNYAAVDSDGSLWVYKNIPAPTIDDADLWELDGYKMNDAKFLDNLPKSYPLDWKDTLITL